MPTLTRKIGEGIVIGHGIRVTVRAVRGKSVQIHVEAPKDVPIWREEIYEELASEKQAALAEGSSLDNLD